ncbi:MAG: hypothetical protein ACYCVD_11850 [Desulfitobacteriaceae bacterium]
MVYMICAVVLTVIFSVVGVYFVLTLHTLRRVLKNAERSVQEVNVHLPRVLEDMDASIHGMRTISDRVRGGVTQAAASLESLTQSPLITTAKVLQGFIRGIRLWRRIQGRRKKNSGDG